MRVSISHGLVTVPRLYAFRISGTISLSINVDREPTIETRRGPSAESVIYYVVELHAAEELATRLESLAAEVRAVAAEILTAQAVAS